MRRLRMPSKPSQRSVRNQLAAWNTLANGAPLALEVHNKRAGKRGKQPESLVNKANQAWSRIKGGELRRNRQGMVDMPGGGKMPFGLGAGTLDLVGPMPVRITASMVGRVMSIYCEIESKTETGRLEDHQIARIEHLRDMGAISGVARGADDCEEILARYLAKVGSDER